MDLDEDGQRMATAALSSSHSDNGRSMSIDDASGSIGHAVVEPGDDDSKPPIKRRAPIACRRCRRMRSKCVHDKGIPPCKSCAEAGLGAVDCIFPVRGQPDNDREYRHPRMRRAEKAIKREPSKVRQDMLAVPVVSQPSLSLCRPKHADEWDLLPPLSDIIEAVHLFTRKYFQLGFIPKELFPRQLEKDHRSVSVFLLLGILSISARFSARLAERYDGEIKAAAFFMERANALALSELYQEPTLERCQAFYLLSLAQQGSGMRNMSYINLGIATRMAVLMHLHREEFYKVSNPSRDNNIRLESARRTLWMLHSQDNLHSGAMSPISLAASDITCLLPSDEDDFALGRIPQARAALEDTPPARENPSLIHQSSRSLFASLIQAHYYWGRVARKAIVSDKSPKPWETTSFYAEMAEKLAIWERQLPQDHRWSLVLLKGHKSVGEDLAYMNVTMVTKLCNVVLRRPYLDEIIKPTATEQPSFYVRMGDELFRNVRELFDQIDAQFAARGSDESVGAQMASFCVYSCGLFSTYLCKYKSICSDRAIVAQGPNMLQRCMSLLMESKEIWPLASRWLESLERYSRDPKAAAVSLDRGMDDGDDRTLRPLHIGYSPSTSGYAQRVGTLPPPLRLPGPSTPGEDSKRNVFLLPSSASPPVPQSSPAAKEPPQPYNQAADTADQGRRTNAQQRHHQQEPQRHQQQRVTHPHGIHAQALPQPLPPPASHIPSQSYLFPNQRMVQQQPAYPQQQPPSYTQHNPMSMLAQAAFEQPPYHGAVSHVVSTHNTPNTQIYQLPQVQQTVPPGYDAVPTPQFFTPPTPTVALGPGNDGFEVELQSWFDDSTQGNAWVGNGMGLGYSM